MQILKINDSLSEKLIGAKNQTWVSFSLLNPWMIISLPRINSKDIILIFVLISHIYYMLLFLWSCQKFCVILLQSSCYSEMSSLWFVAVLIIVLSLRLCQISVSAFMSGVWTKCSGKALVRVEYRILSAEEYEEGWLAALRKRILLPALQLGIKLQKNQSVNLCMWIER
jgi:hypothetical protein